jgi:hypothetical protein
LLVAERGLAELDEHQIRGDGTLVVGMELKEEGAVTVTGNRGEGVTDGAAFPGEEALVAMEGLKGTAVLLADRGAIQRILEEDLLPVAGTGEGVADGADHLLAGSLLANTDEAAGLAGFGGRIVEVGAVFVTSTAIARVALGTLAGCGALEKLAGAVDGAGNIDRDMHAGISLAPITGAAVLVIAVAVEGAGSGGGGIGRRFAACGRYGAFLVLGYRRRRRGGRDALDALGKGGRCRGKRRLGGLQGSGDR